MTDNRQPIRETPDNPIVTIDGCAHCPSCGSWHRDGLIVDKPGTSWLRMYLGNLRRYRWHVSVEEGASLPIGYGLAWLEFNRPAFACYPIPFNILMRTFREWWIWAVRGGWKNFPTVQDRIDGEVASRMQFVDKDKQ